jgi:hypothetical protein
MKMTIFALSALVLMIAGSASAQSQFPAGAQNTRGQMVDTVPTSPICAGGIPCPAGTPGSPTFTTSVLAPGTTGQVKIAVTGTAVQFNATPYALLNGLTYCAATSNVAAMTVGFSNSVTNTADGTGNGEVLQPGQCGSKAATSPSVLYANGTAGDWLSYGGN